MLRSVKASAVLVSQAASKALKSPGENGRGTRSCGLGTDTFRMRQTSNSPAFTNRISQVLMPLRGHIALCISHHYFASRPTTLLYDGALPPRDS